MTKLPAVKDLVLVRGKEKLMCYGTVKDFPSAEQVSVGFKEPHLPRVCEACGASYGLSMNAGTSEIVCMNSGCGHKHGYQSWDEVVNVRDILENITEKKRCKELLKQKGELMSRVNLSPLDREATARIITLVEQEFNALIKNNPA